MKALKLSPVGHHAMRGQLRRYKIPRLDSANPQGAATSVMDSEALELGIDKFNPMPLERRETDLQPVDQNQASFFAAGRTKGCSGVTKNPFLLDRFCSTAAASQPRLHWRSSASSGR